MIAPFLWFASARRSVGSSRCKPFRMMTSAFMINRAVFGVGSNVCESTPSGISPSMWTTLPATLRAMSVIGETVVTTSKADVAFGPAGEDLLSHRLHQLDADLFDRTADPAHKVLVLHAGRGVVLADRVPEVRVTDQSQILEQVEVAIHRREVDAPEALPHPLVDLFSRQVLLRRVHRFEDELPLRRHTVAARAHLAKQLVHGSRAPRRGESGSSGARHVARISGTKTQGLPFG